jgi:hypothetical protein
MAKLVTFLMAATVGCLFNKGETASFEDDVADDLIEREIATPAKVKAKNDKAEAEAEKLKAKALAELEKLDDAAIDKIVADEEVQVAADAEKPAKIAAIIAKRAE